MYVYELCVRHNSVYVIGCNKYNTCTRNSLYFSASFRHIFFIHIRLKITFFLYFYFGLEKKVFFFFAFSSLRIKMYFVFSSKSFWVIMYKKVFISTTNASCLATLHNFSQFCLIFFPPFFVYINYISCCLLWC